MDKSKSLQKRKEGQRFPFWDFGSLFDGDEFLVPVRSFGSAFEQGFNPKVNVIEKKKKVIVEAELPGMEKEDIHVHLEGDHLVIEGERREESETEEEGYVRKESRYGSFRRAVPVGAGVDPAQVKAKFKNGMVRIEMPKPTQEEEPKAQIPIA